MKITNEMLEKLQDLSLQDNVVAVQRELLQSLVRELIESRNRTANRKGLEL